CSDPAWSCRSQTIARHEPRCRRRPCRRRAAGNRRRDTASPRRPWDPRTAWPKSSSQSSPSVPWRLRSVVVARNALRLSNALILDHILEHGATALLIDETPLDLLPRRLALGILVATRGHQLLAALLQLLV